MVNEMKKGIDVFARLCELEDELDVQKNVDEQRRNDPDGWDKIHNLMKDFEKTSGLKHSIAELKWILDIE